MVLDPRARDHVQRIAIGSLGVLLAGAVTSNVWGYLSSRIETRHEDSHPIAAALAEEAESVALEAEGGLTWPPAAGSAEDALAETVGVVAIERTAECKFF